MEEKAEVKVVQRGVIGPARQEILPVAEGGIIRLENPSNILNQVQTIHKRDSMFAVPFVFGIFSLAVSLKNLKKV